MSKNKVLDLSQYKTKDEFSLLAEHEYLGLGKIDSIDISKNDLVNNFGLDNPDAPVLDLMEFMCKPEYFPWTCKLLFNVDLLPFQAAILNELWNRKFPMLLATRGGGKSWLLALYSLLRAFFANMSGGAKIVIVGAAFRQSKILFEYMEQFWRAAPIFRSIVGEGKMQGPKRDIDRCNFYVGNSEVIAIPLGDGSKIRGLRANYIIADEFASIPLEVFEVVVKGFGAVSQSPVERVKEYLRIDKLRQSGLAEQAKAIEEAMDFGNQTIISGTASYTFNHFYQYWKRYKAIVESKGDQRKLEEIFQGQIPRDFNWKDYSIIRIPWHKLPRGFMDDAQLAQAKVTINKSLYQMEYGAVFPADSEGFFRRSLIETCVANDKNNITFPSSGPAKFNALTSGSPNAQYVWGIDPASERDNFSITILEVHPEHRRIVYCWTINRQQMHLRLKKAGQDTTTSFYAYCSRKIRELMKRFPTQHIGMDTQGGGIAVMESLHDINMIESGEHFLWPYIKKGDFDPYWWEEAEKLTDGEAGLHILHMVNFANADFTRQANHGLRFDLENKLCLFPMFDTWTLGEALASDKIAGREFDTLEDCVMEIEELKNELTTIIHDQTTTGRDRWDTPEIKLPGGKKGRVRKDRYTSLIIANMIARSMEQTIGVVEYKSTGGFVGDSRLKGKSSGKMYIGPEHIVSKMTGAYGIGISRR